jgi:hypothetical protein
MSFLPVFDEFVHKGHDELRSTTAKVAPTSGSAVDEAHDFAVEEGAHPELARDKRGKREADEETDDDEAVDGGDSGHGENSRRGQHDDECAGVAWSDEVAERTHEKTRSDRAGDGSHGSVGDVFGRHVEVVADDGNERRRCECRHEASEEGDPGKMECAHVWFLDAPGLEDRRLVL